MKAYHDKLVLCAYLRQKLNSETMKRFKLAAVNLRFLELFVKV